MRILAVGDIFGKTGRKIVSELVPRIKVDYNIDFVIANVENATHGKSVSWNHYLAFKANGIDLMTSGNHIFALDETKAYIANCTDLLRPLNANPYHPGHGSTLVICKGRRIRVTNLIGNAFMPSADNPYFALEKVLANDDSDIHIVDFHAEATAEKIALALYFDGKISALYGTHTHVQTADERILPAGTAFLTDVGMSGPRDGVIGANLDCIIERAKYGYSSKMEPHSDAGQFNGVIFEFDEQNKVRTIQRLNFQREHYKVD